MVGLHITRVTAKIMQALEKASLGDHSIGRWFSRMGLSQAYDRAHHLNDRIAASSAPSVFSGPRRGFLALSTFGPPGSRAAVFTRSCCLSRPCQDFLPHDPKFTVERSFVGIDFVSDVINSYLRLNFYMAFQLVLV